MAYNTDDFPDDLVTTPEQKKYYAAIFITIIIVVAIMALIMRGTSEKSVCDNVPPEEKGDCIQTEFDTNSR